MLRNVGVVILGLVVGSAINMALILANLLFFPLPEGTDMNNAEQMAAFIGSLPPAGFVLPLLAHLAQAFVGGAIAARFGTADPRVLAGVIAALTALGGVINLVQLNPPAWMWVELPLYVAAWWGAVKVSGRASSSSER